LQGSEVVVNKARGGGVGKGGLLKGGLGEEGDRGGRDCFRGIGVIRIGGILIGGMLARGMLARGMLARGMSSRGMSSIRFRQGRECLAANHRTGGRGGRRILTRHLDRQNNNNNNSNNNRTTIRADGTEGVGVQAERGRRRVAKFEIDCDL
jgi:hypothetical protein